MNLVPQHDTIPSLRGNTVKTTFISDTHGQHRSMIHPPPESDLIVAVGDITKYGSREELRDFLEWMTAFAPRGLIVAGNHDRCFEAYPRWCRELCEGYGVHYLQDESIDIEGIHFYGSPWTPRFGNWHFMMDRGSKDLADTWALIPNGVDVLLTHGPRHGVLDYSPYSKDAQGCELLKPHVERRVRPRYHIFGHMHANYGYIDNRYTGIVSYNVAICDEAYSPCRAPVVLNLRKK